MATTNTFTQAPISDTDAHFRLWGSALSAAFAALGLVKDTDVSQINWATVVKPTGASTMMGYEIWRFADGATQTACPVYFKIQYGSVAGSASNPGIILQVGQGSDNAGNLTGTVSTAQTFGSNTNNASTYACYVSSDTGRINVAMFTGSINCWAFYIERIKDDTGTPTTAGVNIFVWGCPGGSGSVVGQQYLPLSGAAYPATPMTTPMCAMPSTGQASYGVNMGLFPIFPNLGYAANPDLGGLMYFTGDLASTGTALSVTMYGTPHTFITLGPTSNASTASLNGNTTSHSVAVRYE